MKIASFILTLSVLFLSSFTSYAQKANPAKKTVTATKKPLPVTKPAATAKKPILATKPKAPAVVIIDTVSSSDKADSIVAYSKKFIGIKYRYGGEDKKNGFDCAGFVCFVYRKYGIKLPRTADAQALEGIAVWKKDAQPGDLIFFKGSNKKNKAVGHSGIVIENEDGNIKFISATVNAGIHIDDLDGAYWKERFICVRRIIVESESENVSSK